MIVNLTPHSLRFVTETGETIKVIESSGQARVEMTRKVTGELEGLPVYSVSFGKVTGLPEPAEGTVYVVSSIVAVAISGRDDVYVPGDLVRDENGRVVGCKGLAQEMNPSTAKYGDCLKHQNVEKHRG